MGLANMVAEERKAGGAPLSFQYANYEVAQDLFARLRDGGGSKEEQNNMMEILLDPKPPSAKEEAAREQDDRDRDRDDRDGGYDRPTNRDRERDDFEPPRRPPERNYGGMRSDQKFQGRSVCRQFQRDGRCTYGDACKFVHQGEDGRPFN